MAIGDVWLFRIVHQDTGKPAQGVPVTVLDKGGNAAGHWVSDADGIVAVPRRDILKLRLRVGLRSEDPIELATATLGAEPTPLAAPSQLPSSTSGAGERVVRDLQAVHPASAGGAPPPPARGPDPVDVPGHVPRACAPRCGGARSGASMPPPTHPPPAPCEQFGTRPAIASSRSTSSSRSSGSR